MTNMQQWFRGVRSSKFRHVYGQPVRREHCYENVNITKNAHDANFCAVNPKFIAIVTEVAGGGAFLVLPLQQTGRVDVNACRVAGHSGTVLDIKWNPFNDNIIASCSEDCTIKLWYIPDSGLSAHLTDCLADLHGHKRRVSYIEWHPTANNVLASVGFDSLIILWDVEKGEALNVIDIHRDVIQSLSFNRDGSRIATTCKDKKVRVIDPRTGFVISEGIAHDGVRCSKVIYLKNSLLATVGFSRHNDRQLSIWNENNLSSPLHTEQVDSSSGVIFPYFDYDTNVLFLAGKGDGNIRYYEIVDSKPYVHFLNQFISGLPQKSLGFMPKRGCDVKNCEIFRFYKLHTTKPICEPISMIVPRKSDQFQDDLYPDSAAPIATVSASDWMNGVNRPPQLMSMQTGIINGTNNNEGMTSKINKSKLPQRSESLKIQDSENKYQVKLAFLTKQTVPDYRPIDQRGHPGIPDVVPNSIPSNYIIPPSDVNKAERDKLVKTSANQTTKFQQIQQKFGGKSIFLDEKMKSTENENESKQKTYSQLQKAYDDLCEEMSSLRKELASKDKKIEDLETVITKLRTSQSA